MKFTERLLTFLKTLNPDTYEGLCALSLPDAWKQFFFNYLLLFVLMLLLFIPALLFGAPALQEKLTAFDSFELDGNFSASQPVTILEHPDIVVDLTPQPVSEGFLVFTKTSFSWKRWLLFGEKTVAWSEVKDVTGISDTTLFLLLLFLVPSLAFWMGLLYLAFYLSTILLCSLLVYLLPKIWRHRLTYSAALKLSLFAATIMMAVELLLFPFWRNWWLPLLLYLLFLVIGVVLVGNRDLSGKGKKKGKGADIWE